MIYVQGNNSDLKTAYLSLGSNMGDRELNLKKALELLQSEDIIIERCSSWYETSPVGKTDQGWFLNRVVCIKTILPVRKLLQVVLSIENKLGRVRREKWGPRIIDIDILLYEDLNIDEPDLKIPHPRMLERAFVIVPLAEIAPKLVLPNGELAIEAAKNKFSGQEILSYDRKRC
ncbi:MAG: 2-amino-4-hydroxy-6-hydroxymethyldihydropteridine diphosphokinase [Clostridia bacterium]|nr:2-amino-4-hydroxy-6-hydroxymethyldihydropteridine diphosphokinase [Clostridia bacterium]